MANYVTNNSYYRFETLFGSLKVERLHGMQFATRGQAKDTGIWSLGGLGGDIRQNEKITMNDLLAHRGPDDEGSLGVMEVSS